ncbi:MAG TPA: hypothetical protein VJ810_11145 [Blastocatellia bacterium]|nr:hypothetical protein [Blastocatellia bacterium]
MIPIRFALSFCLFAPLLAVYSQTADQTKPTKIDDTEFRAISTGKLATFEKELSDLAGQGFRLERLLESFTVFYQAALFSRRQTEGGAARYEYKLLTTRRVSTLEMELEGAAGEGYEVRGIMSAGKPYVGSEIVLVLERPLGDKNERFHYRILSETTGKENKFKDNLQKAVSEGYRPIKAIRHVDVGFGAFVGAGGPAFLLILSRRARDQGESADDPEYMILETVRISTLQKEINQAAKEGYRLFLSSAANVALMARDKRNHQPRYEYKLLKLKKQAEGEELLTQSQLGYDYRATLSGMTAALELDLQSGTDSRVHEYKFLKFPNKEEEKEKFLKEISEAVASGFRFLDLTAWGSLAVILVR